MKGSRFYFFSVVMLCFSMAAEAVGVTSFQFERTSYNTYDKVQATFGLDETYSNPYDPDVIKVYAAVTKPGGGGHHALLFP